MAQYYKVVFTLLYVIGHGMMRFSGRDAWSLFLAGLCRDLSVWCFLCDEYLDALCIPELRPAFQELHRMKFGTNPPLPAEERRSLGGEPG